MISLASTVKGVAHCSTCEAVCCRLKVVLQPEDHIPEHLTIYSPEGLHLMKRGEDGWCVALDRVRRNCSIYETRPSACGRFLMNGPYCKAIRTEYSGADGTRAWHEPVA
ncbi:YkgJ family cysteine cluster protein [Dyella solisilvae]|uniref:YkgJ family cysteine cluster protein n=1 Tax=Dyella solisilvae TaxID=1920168 RepID=A0A370K2F9_9GAMM|nr:YkgJ family cysteine cluster protein [Dyella solisilvae]RDI96822.1 YkgJ family cysteine cluster protein [Dyella solisilvae]